MEKYTIDFNKQIKEGVASVGKTSLQGKYSKIIFCGVGGSIIPAEIISMLWIDGLNYYIHRDYGLPHWASKDDLVICTSWSGNTEETLSSFEEAIKKSIPVVGIGKGGSLERMASETNKIFIKLGEDGILARFGVFSILASILTLLNNSAIINYRLSEEFSSKKFSDEVISSKIGQKLPLIYSSYQWRYLARFWKIHFNENCKIHAFSNYVPEAAHNEIAGYTQNQKDKYFPILLIDNEESESDRSKLQKFSSFMKEQNIDHEIIYLDGTDRFEKILNNYNLAVAVSVNLAISMNIEPFDTAIIEKFKKA